jgi:hypothetical protein
MNVSYYDSMSRLFRRIIILLNFSYEVKKNLNATAFLLVFSELIDCKSFESNVIQQ